ncbi:hypothetical protein [Oxynema aestuarii]|nr:hypothetical protein [Oxynema aestuarii]
MALRFALRVSGRELPDWRMALTGAPRGNSPAGDRLSPLDC